MRIVDSLVAAKPVSWRRGETSNYLNPDIVAKVHEAAARFSRFEPWVAKTYGGHGVIESALQRALVNDRDVWLKRDDALPISGSIKARGGIHEVFRLSEQYPVDKPPLVVCSTGNLGLSIGTVGPALGFDTEVHMSADAKQWKKNRLVDKGAQVVEHDAQFSDVIAAARDAATQAGAFFIDDEDSLGLLAGYAVAGERLKAQFDALGMKFSATNPLHIYLPCGVGGGPGGVTFGVKMVYGDAVRCHVVEPVTCPAMTLGQITGRGCEISCADIGLSGVTIADGLAVQRPSPLVSREVAHLFSGFHTVTDTEALRATAQLEEATGVLVEPSAAVATLVASRAEEKGTHLAWLTGGSLIPEEDRTLLRREAKLSGLGA
ncbi:D-serine ammonia-lyase [Corynebacterium mayonis]|uniref:D-serine ammonia-lyase n=1 Tax=Corynebacterium mayonis TaxID=3062461 RepID=UPI0031403FFE